MPAYNRRPFLFNSEKIIYTADVTKGLVYLRDSQMTVIDNKGTERSIDAFRAFLQITIIHSQI